MIDWALLILRVGLGILFPFHGWMKLNPNGPVKGPAGFAGFLKQMGVPLPLFFAWIVVLLETGGAALLVLGLGTRLLAIAFVIDMLVAIQLVKRGMAKKRFMESDGTGWEFEFVLLIAALALVVAGAGAISIDRMIGLFSGVPGGPVLLRPAVLMTYWTVKFSGGADQLIHPARSAQSSVFVRCTTGRSRLNAPRVTGAFTVIPAWTCSTMTVAGG